MTVPLLLLLIARLITGWMRQPRAQLARRGRRLAHLARSAWPISRRTRAIPRLFDFRGAIKDIKADAGPNSLVLFEPPDMRYVLEYYAPEPTEPPLRPGVRSAGRGARCSCSPRSRATSQFFNETNKVVGQLDFFRQLVRRFKTAQTVVWEFR